MRQNESKQGAAVSTEKGANQSPDKVTDKCVASNPSLPSSTKDTLTRSASVQEEEPLVSAALNMDISTGTTVQSDLWFLTI
jgi:hypothetical protein